MELKMSLKGNTRHKVERLQERLGHKKTQTTIRWIIDMFELK